MQVEIEKVELLKMISLAQTVAEKRANMPNLVNLLFEAEEDTLKVYATDLEISLAAKTTAKVLKPGRVTVHAKHIFEIIKELNDLPVRLTALDNSWVQIQQKRYSSKLHGSDPREYPVFPVIGGCEFTKIPAQTLREMISKVIFSVSNDDTRYHLNGVYLERYWSNNQFNLRMVATDGHRLAVVNRTVDGVTSGEDPTKLFGVIIPRKGVHELNKILETVDNSVELSIEGAQLVVKHQDTILLIRLIEGRYPNYQQLIPQTINHNIILPREPFFTSIKRVSFHAHQKSKSVLIEVSPSKMLISSNNSELGDASDEIEVSYDGPGFKVNLNARYLLEILAATSTELVDLQLKDTNSPLIVRPHGDANYTCVVMPMRF
ncbi:MAG: polymerase subunit beta [Pseudomonadota bacterium]|jgi:DNA polymerase-3 subunit beta